MIDLSTKTDLSLYAEIVREIRQVCRSDFFLCGATARDLLLEYAHGIPAGRATRDVDFGVMVHSHEEFQAIRHSLAATGKFDIVSPTTRISYGNMTVDLIPFGAIEEAGRIVTWPPGDVAINMLGYSEALQKAEEVLLPLEVTVKVATLPTQAMLKLIAWGDNNPERRSKDAQDFRIIVKSYHRIADRERFYGLEELFKRSDFDVERAGAWLLGYDGGLQTHKSSQDVVQRIATITTEQHSDEQLMKLAESMGSSVDENLALIRWYSEGMRAAVSSY